MTKDKLLFEMRNIAEFLCGIMMLSDGDEPIYVLADVARDKMLTLLQRLDDDDFSYCCKQHWLHGGKCD